MKRYLVTLLSTAIITMTCCVAANVILDPFGILGTGVGLFFGHPNERVSKAAFLADHCREYTGYIMGDSRAEILSSEDLGEDDRRFYNYSVPRDEIGGVLRRLDFLARRGCPVSTVLVGESIDVFHDETDTSLLTVESPLLTHRSWVPLLAKYFLSYQPFMSVLRYAFYDHNPHYRYYSDGHVDYLLYSISEADFGAARCAPRKPISGQRQDFLRKLSDYRRLSEMARRERFQVIVWITPLNKWVTPWIEDPVTQEFLHHLRDIPGISVVQSDLNSSMLSDHALWYDCVHFQHPVFDQLLRPQIDALLKSW
jgi:hypothetical protein